MSTTHERLPLINEGFAFKKAGERITHSEWNAVMDTFAKCYNNLVIDTDETASTILLALADKAEQTHTHDVAAVKGLSEHIAAALKTIDLSAFVTSATLDTKLSAALTSAKASGLFDGANGKDGKDGADGTPATHSWNGTVLTVTSASGTSSADLKGEKGDKGNDGSDGKDGADYILTDDDKSEIAAQVRGDCVSYSEAQALTNEQKETARNNIGAVSKDELSAAIANTDPNCHAEYFTITDDGAVSLKPEYRGASPVTTFPYAISDKGVNNIGSKNSELPEDLVVPEVVNEIAVTSLCNGIFMSNRKIKSVTIPTHITHLPKNFAWSAINLEEIKDTEQIKSIGRSVLTSTAIRKAHFPNLETMNKDGDGALQFSNCALLVSADLGKVTEISERAFQFCDNLSAVHNTEGITKVGNQAFMKTNRLKNLTFLSNLTSVGDKAFLYSRVDYDWWSMPESVFGEKSTVRQLYTEKWWEGCTYTPCDTPMLSVFDQSNPEWRDAYINDFGHEYGTTYQYKNGCVVVSAAMAYSALAGVKFAAPSEFIDAVADKGGNMNENPRDYETIPKYLTVLGCTVTDNLSYNGTSNGVKNLQTMYDALANGALVLATVDGSYATDNATHMVVIHGINANGEVLVQDPTSSAVAYLGLDNTASYAIPIQNIVGNAALSDGFMIVYPKTVEI